MGAQRVLVIEDENAAREALESLLREEGYTVRAAPSGQAGIDSCRDFDPDVVVCDYYLPDIDGLRVLREIRRVLGKPVRVIMVTAGLSDADDELALRREADAFLAKPIDLGRLHAALHPPPASASAAAF
jgi:DNA-binding response OmpR family regulator